MSGDEAHVIFVPLAPGHAGNDFALDNNRAGRIAVPECAVGDDAIPFDATRPRIEGHQVGVGRCGKDLVAVYGEGPGVASKSGIRRDLERLFILPQ